jgi:hypothetical protein
MAARRFIIPNRDPAMSRAELTEYKREVSSLSQNSLEMEYRDAIAKVRSTTLPGPRSMQTLVAIWSELWKRKTQ